MTCALFHQGIQATNMATAEAAGSPSLVPYTINNSQGCGGMWFVEFGTHGAILVNTGGKRWEHDYDRPAYTELVLEQAVLGWFSIHEISIDQVMCICPHTIPD